MSEIKEHMGRFLKNFAVAAGHCAFEDGEIAVSALFIFGCLGLLLFLPCYSLVPCALATS